MVGGIIRKIGDDFTWVIYALILQEYDGVTFLKSNSNLPHPQTNKTNRRLFAFLIAERFSESVFDAKSVTQRSSACR